MVRNTIDALGAIRAPRCGPLAPERALGGPTLIMCFHELPIGRCTSLLWALRSMKASPRFSSTSPLVEFAPATAAKPTVRGPTSSSRTSARSRGRWRRSLNWLSSASSATSVRGCSSFRATEAGTPNRVGATRSVCRPSTVAMAVRASRASPTYCGCRWRPPPLQRRPQRARRRGDGVWSVASPDTAAIDELSPCVGGDHAQPEPRYATTAARTLGISTSRTFHTRT